MTPRAPDGLGHDRGHQGTIRAHRGGLPRLPGFARGFELYYDVTAAHGYQCGADVSMQATTAITERVMTGLAKRQSRPDARTAEKYSNLSGQHRPDATDVGWRPAPMANIDVPASRSYRGGYGD
jgi:hypothetical protein